MARATFPRVSFDLIYARQGQTLDGWRRELGRALAMAVDHLSLYQLTIEPGTRFGDLAARGRLRGLPAPELAADMYRATQEICGAAGLRGLRDLEPCPAGRREPAQPRLLALRRLCRDRAGRARPADASAARAGRPRRSAAPEAWLAAVEARAGGTAARTPVAPGEQAVEMLMMGLRLRRGDRPRPLRRAGRAPRMPEERVAELAEPRPRRARDGERLRVTPAGRPLLDAVLRRLLA